MIGDGANDCGAISAADVGISFGNAEASFTSCFSSLSTSISCIPAIIRTGCCSSSINMEIFKYYMVCCVLKFVANMMAVQSCSNFSDNMSIYYNYFNSLLFLLLFCFSQPNPEAN